MIKPIIGITPEVHFEPENARSRGKIILNWNYAEVIADAGGVPIIIPPTADLEILAPLLHGWLIPGGLDIDAARFGEDNHSEVELQDPARFETEKRLYALLKPEIPILGICYGCQFLNVIRGGTLHQHLPDRLGHNRHSEGTLHHYSVEPDSLLGSVIGSDKAEGKTYNHQSIKGLGSNLVITANSEDGVVGGIQATDRPFLIGVQWHPERTVGATDSQSIFKAFIGAARQVAEKQYETVR